MLAQGQENLKIEGIWKELKDEFQNGIEQARRELAEINLMVEQSQLEVTKLTQRNASITAHIQQMHPQFDSLPRPDIRNTYESALDAQQRLFVMRGQLDKLQSDRTHIERHIALMERVIQAIEGGTPDKPASRNTATAIETVEMLIQAQETERQRLARQMHDEPAQALSNFILQTEIAMRLFDIDQAKAKEELGSLKMAATSTFQKVRDFIFELRPMMLDDLGLAPTLGRYVDAVKTQGGSDVRLAVSGMDQRLESYLEVMIFRAVQEMVSNAVRQSQATQVKVQVDMLDSIVKVSVDDNGKGYDSDTVFDTHVGLKVIRDRVVMLGGSMEVDSSAGQGTRIAFQVPAQLQKSRS